MKGQLIYDSTREQFRKEHLMAKPSDRFHVENLSVRPHSDESVRTFTPKVGGSVTPSAPTSEAAPSTPPPPAKNG